MSDYLSLLADPGVYGPIWLSAKIALAATLLHLFFGVGIGYLLSRERLPLRGLLDALVTLPLVFPPIATGFFLLLLFGREGWFGEALGTVGVEVIFTYWGVLLAAFVAGLPLIAKPVQSAIESTAAHYREAAYVLGKSELQTLFWVILPNIRPSIIAGLTLAFGRSMGEVGITLMLGGNIIGQTETVSLAIYNAVFDGSFDRAAALSILLGVISLALFLFLRRISVAKTGALQ
jgi:molybdate transport system permease protein